MVCWSLLTYSPEPDEPKRAYPPRGSHDSLLQGFSVQVQQSLNELNPPMPIHSRPQPSPRNPPSSPQKCNQTRKNISIILPVHSVITCQLQSSSFPHILQKSKHSSHIISITNKHQNLFHISSAHSLMSPPNLLQSCTLY